MDGRRVTRRVVVVGGGTAGAATALALQRVGIRTVIVERSAPPGWKVGEGLPPAANPFLQLLGIWDRFQADGHLPSYGNASAWGSADLVDASFMFNPHGRGWHLDRQRFDVMLLRAAVEHGAELVRGTATVDSRPGPGGERWLRVTSDGREEQPIRTSFVVDASGRSASVARCHRARREHLDRLVGVVGVFATASAEDDQDTRTIVEAVEDGWWYSAPLPGGRLIVAFMSDGDVVRQRAAHRLDGWSNLLGETANTRARVVRLAGCLLAPPRAVLANGSRLLEVVGAGWLAVGDAAIAHDPLSSQGVASALLLGLWAGEAIRDHLDGQTGALDGYRVLVGRLFDEYRAGLAYYYRQERRWPNAPFWTRRADDGLAPDHRPLGKPSTSNQARRPARLAPN
jgi:flavin-dependent dehydrogenase